MPVVKRKYDSLHRRRQAEATRGRLAAAARKAFASQGYAATTVAAIAEEAGIAVPTFYATYGSKRNVLFALLEAIEADADAASTARQLVRRKDDARAQLQLLVAFHVRLFGSGADVLRVLRGAGSADPDLAEVWREGEARRLAMETPLVRGWARAGLLRNDVTETEALDYLWVMTGPDVFALFTGERGWPVERFGVWLEQQLAKTLFAARKRDQA